MNRFQIFLLTIILCFFFSIAGCSPSGTPFKGFDENLPELDDAAKLYLLQAARAKISGSPLSSAQPHASVNEPCSKEVFVAAFARGKSYRLAKASESTLLASVQAAASELSLHSPVKGNHENVTLTVHILKSVKKLTKRDPRRLKRALEPGLNGLALVDKDRAFFQLGEQVLWDCWGNEGEDRILGSKMVMKRMEKISKEAGLSGEQWKEKELYAFTTESFKEEKAGGTTKAVEMYRGNVLLDRAITRGHALSAAAYGGKNLALHQKDDGRFGYIYYPCEDEFDKGYNIVRHCGTIYSLFQIYNATGDPAFKDAALKGLEYIEDKIVVPEKHPDISILVDRGRSALGSNALLTLALVEMPEHLLNQYPKFRDLRDRLAKALLAYQIEDGSFFVYYKQVVAQRPPKKQPIYYPGETFLAYVRYYEATKDQRFLDAAVKAAEYQLFDFEKSGVPCNWAIQAYGRMYQQKQEDKYALACYSMADELLTHQWNTFKKAKSKLDDFYGGFDNGWPPRTTPAASRTEALTEAYAMAVFKKDQPAIERYSTAVSASLWFILNQQYRPENSYYFRYPEKTLGGIKGSPIANDIRIDYTQHSITSILHGLAVLESNFGKGEIDPDLKIIDVEAEGISVEEAESKVKEIRGETLDAA